MIQGVGKFDYQPATQLEGGRSHDTMQVEHMAGRTAGSIPPGKCHGPRQWAKAAGAFIEFMLGSRRSVLRSWR